VDILDAEVQVVAQKVEVALVDVAVGGRILQLDAYRAVVVVGVGHVWRNLCYRAVGVEILYDEQIFAVVARKADVRDLGSDLPFALGYD